MVKRRLNYLSLVGNANGMMHCCTEEQYPERMNLKTCILKKLFLSLLLLCEFCSRAFHEFRNAQKKTAGKPDTVSRLQKRCIIHALVSYSVQ
jgi:hypothetical protein